MQKNMDIEQIKQPSMLLDRGDIYSLAVAVISLWYEQYASGAAVQR